jgi:hypothetical protein
MLVNVYLGCDTVLIDNMLPAGEACCLPLVQEHQCGSKLPQNLGNKLPNYTASSVTEL